MASEHPIFATDENQLELMLLAWERWAAFPRRRVCLLASVQEKALCVLTSADGSPSVASSTDATLRRAADRRPP